MTGIENYIQSKAIHRTTIAANKHHSEKEDELRMIFFDHRRRRASLLEKYGPVMNWDEDSCNLLKSYFGDMATHVINGFAMFRYSNISDEYSGCSFKDPNNPELYFYSQLKWVYQMYFTLSYDFSIAEFIRYSSWIGDEDLSYLFAGAVEAGDESALKLMVDILLGNDEVGKVSTSIIKALLLLDRIEARNAVEVLLLSAQREEGLRQSILELIDEGHPNNFKHFLKVIQAHNLTRFSSTIVAFDSWTGLQLQSPSEELVKKAIGYALKYISCSKKNKPSLEGLDNLEIYMALWSHGVNGLIDSANMAEELLNSNQQHTQAVALFYLHVATSTCPVTMQLENIKLLKSSSLDVIQFTTYMINQNSFDEDLLHALIDVLQRFPKRISYKSQVFDWLNGEYNPDAPCYWAIKVANRVRLLDELIPLFGNMTSDCRVDFCKSFLGVHYASAKKDELTEAQLSFALQILSDKSREVQDIGFLSLGSMNNLGAESLSKIEALLGRKGTALRKNSLELLTRQPLQSLFSVIKNLGQSSSVEKRVAALDLLLHLQKQNCSEKHYFDLLRMIKSNKIITDRETTMLDNFVINDPIPSRVNGFGLYNHSKLTKIKPPQPLQNFSNLNDDNSCNKFIKLSVSDKVIVKELKKLDNLLEEYRGYEVKKKENWNGEVVSTRLLDKISQSYLLSHDCDKKQALDKVPLLNIWNQWFENSGLTYEDLVLLMDYEWLDFSNNYYYSDRVWEQKKARMQFYFIDLLTKPEIQNELKHYGSICNVIKGLVCSNFSKKHVKWILDTTEAMFYSLESGRFPDCEPWRHNNLFISRLRTIDNMNLLTTMSNTDLYRLWNLRRWRFETSVGQGDLFGNVTNELNCECLQRKLISESDFYYRVFDDSGSWKELAAGPKAWNGQLAQRYTFLEPMMAKAIEKVLAIELKRGDTPTEVSNYINFIPIVYGQDVFFGILQGLGKGSFVRNFEWTENNYDTVEISKQEIFSTLLKRCQPTERESKESFATLAKSTKIKESRLIEAALYAPQWMTFVDSALKWDYFASAYWWLHAHATESWNVMKESEISRYSQLDMEEFREGTVDVQWFYQFYNKLGEKRWKILYKAAKYISGSAGYKRVQIFADALLGKLSLEEIESKITDKRNKDLLRAYGTVPLNSKNSEMDLLHRYKFIMLFKKGIHQFGVQRRAAESLAISVALENLARNAGYIDSVRLTWRMESLAAEDILEKAKAIEIGDVTVALKVLNSGQAKLIVTKGTKTLKAVPAKLKKNSEIVALKEYANELTDQYKRSRLAFEECMVCEEEFTFEEVSQLMTHPVVAPLLKVLVLKQSLSDSNIVGFWQDGSLYSPDGTAHKLGNLDMVSIAHPLDLFNSGKWSSFQSYCFDNQLKQPFKQIFREMYVPTRDELKAKTVSHRYSGHQVMANKAAALLKARGWCIDYEDGLKKIFPKAEYMVRISSQIDWFTNSEVEASAIERIEFCDRSSYPNIPFNEINPIHFSEVMRDLDLVVSVAHSSKVDPEATQSTVEMRSILAQETAKMLALKNVKTSKNRLLIEGRIKRYSLHLGSGVVHCQPGGALSILPVNPNHQGRIFLPFVDSDPKTAEILSKMILLANDDKIKDPTILEQINYLGVNE